MGLSMHFLETVGATPAPQEAPPSPEFVLRLSENTIIPPDHRPSITRHGAPRQPVPSGIVMQHQPERMDENQATRAAEPRDHLLHNLTTSVGIWPPSTPGIDRLVEIQERLADMDERLRRMTELMRELEYLVMMALRNRRSNVAPSTAPNEPPQVPVLRLRTRRAENEMTADSPSFGMTTSVAEDSPFVSVEDALGTIEDLLRDNEG